MLTTGWASRSPHSTTSRLLTIVALRSSSRCDDVLRAEHVERHFDHADRAFDDLLPCRDDGGGLLTPQHRVGDLRRVREMADPRLDQLDAGAREPLLDLLCQPLRHLGHRAAQRQLAFYVRVVRKDRRHGAEGRLALHVHEVLVVVDLEHGFGGLDDPPDDDGGDLDRVADVVVDLQFAAFEVADSQRHEAPRRKRIDPAQARSLDRALVASEQLDRPAPCWDGRS